MTVGKWQIGISIKAWLFGKPAAGFDANQSQHVAGFGSGNSKNSDLLPVLRLKPQFKLSQSAKQGNLEEFPQ